jgi:hypothetical protein
LTDFIAYPGGSLYEMLFPGGVNRAIAVLVLLGGFRHPADVGRIRDGWIERDPEDRYLIRLVTRNGGSNRKAYRRQIDQLRSHPLYIRDADHEYYSTYVSFWFQLPIGKISEEMLEEVAHDPIIDNKQRWDQAIERHIQLLKDPAQARHPGVAASHDLLNAIVEFLNRDEHDAQDET